MWICQKMQHNQTLLFLDLSWSVSFDHYYPHEERIIRLLLLAIELHVMVRHF